MRQRVCLDGGDATRAPVRQLLIDDTRLNRVQPEPTVLLGDVAVYEAHLPRLVEDVVGELHGAVQLCGLRDDDILRKITGGGLKRDLVLGEGETEAVRGRGEAPARHTRRRLRAACAACKLPGEHLVDDPRTLR